MRKIDILVAEKLNKMHKLLAERINKKRKEGDILETGSKVWYRRPENSGTKLDTRWLGPALVKAREGSRSYVIEVKPGAEMKAHRSFLKPFIEDIFNGQPIPLFYHQRTEIDVEAEIDEWEVDKVVRHIIEEGKLKFLTSWLGHTPDEASWNEARDFLPRYNVEFVDYCKSKGLKLDLVEHLG